MIPSDFELVQACSASYQPGTPYFQPEGFADRLFLTETADYAILAIEGTVDLPMWTGDFLALGVAEHPTTSGNGLPFLHADFYEASLRLLPAVQAVVQRKPVGLTGHSRGAGITAPLAALLIQAFDLGHGIGSLLDRGQHRAVVIGHRDIQRRGGTGILGADFSGIEDRQVNSRSRPQRQGVAGEKIGHADRLETGKGGQINVGIEFGMRRLAARRCRADPRPRRHDVGPPRQKIGG